ncbi:acyltransferase family protein [Streptomyces sp. M19]
MSNGYDVVQGHCVIRNGDSSWVSKLVAVEFEAIYAVSHPGRTRLYGFGVFGGSNGFWRTDTLARTRMHGSMLTEDIDSTMRALNEGARVAVDRTLISRELAPTMLGPLWNQRARWAQGWLQVSMKHLWRSLRSPVFSLRQKAGMFVLLGWREVQPWLTLQILPVLLYTMWRAGGPTHVDWLVPACVLAALSTMSAGLIQAAFAWRLAEPQIRARRGWFWSYLLVSTVFYTHFKNMVARQAHLKEALGERQWRVTPGRGEGGVRQVRIPPAPREGPAPSTGRSAPRSRASEIEGYRGIAALSTLIFHVWQQYYRYDADGSHPPIANKYVGSLISMEVVDLFLVLSAYLLTLAYARAAINGGSVRSARTFLFRRAIRIVPLYFLAVCVVWSTRNPTLPGDWRDLVEHLTFTHIFDDDRIFYTVGPTWSLSLEIMFYLVLVVLGPLAIRACRPLPRRRSRVAVCVAGCAVLFVLPVAWVGFAHYGLGIPHTDWAAYFGPQARFSGFAAGMFLAVLVTALGDRGKLRAKWSTGLALFVVAGAYLLSLVSEPENFLFTYYHQVSAVLWFVLLFCTIHVQGRIGWHRRCAPGGSPASA